MKNYFSCPVCRQTTFVGQDGKSLFCNGVKKHCFDFSSSGYIHLLPSHPSGGDSPEAICSRTSFLSAGYYRPIAEAVRDALKTLSNGFVVDAGCGEGYYTNFLASQMPDCDFLGFDLSRSGVNAAAKAAKRQNLPNAGYAVAGIFDLPLPDECAEAVVSLFAPCAAEEFKRILKPNGILILVGAGKKHLLGLKKVLYGDPYENPGREDKPSDMTLVSENTLSYTVTVEGNQTIQDLFSMTPYYWRTSPADKQKLDGLETLTTEVETDIFVYRK